MSTRPLRECVLVERINNNVQSKHGLYIPDEKNQKNVQGKVIAVGTGAVLKDGTIRPLDIQVGDIVIFSEDAATKTTIEGKEALIVREPDIFAVVG